MNAQLKCTRCGKLFEGSEQQVRNVRNNGRKPYCSPACRNAASRERFAQPAFRSKT